MWVGWGGRRPETQRAILRLNKCGHLKLEDKCSDMFSFWLRSCIAYSFLVIVKNEKNIENGIFGFIIWDFLGYFLDLYLTAAINKVLHTNVCFAENMDII